MENYISVGRYVNMTTLLYLLLQQILWYYPFNKDFIESPSIIKMKFKENVSKYVFFDMKTYFPTKGSLLVVYCGKII